MQEINWPKLRNAIKRRLRYRVEPQDLADCVQEACGFALLDIGDEWEDMVEHYGSANLACWCIARRAVGRVLRGQTFCYQPAARERWEDADYAGTLPYLLSRPGVSAYSQRISANGRHESADELEALGIETEPKRFLPIHTLRKGCHRR